MFRHQNHSNVIVWKVNFIFTVKFLDTRKKVLCSVVTPKRMISSEMKSFFSFIRCKNHTNGKGDWSLELSSEGDRLYVRRTLPIKDMLDVIEGSHVSLVTFSFMASCINWKKSLLACACMITMKCDQHPRVVNIGYLSGQRWVVWMERDI